MPLFETYESAKLKADFKAWSKRRRNTIIAYFIQRFCLGMEYSMAYSTLWLYLQTLIQPTHIDIYYGLISVAYYVFNSLSVLLLGRLVDRTRNMWLLCVLLNLLIVCGNVIYSLSFSPFCLIIGRSLAGIGGAMRSISMGEIGRVYNRDKRPRIFTILSIAFTVGLVMGPAVNLAFVNVDFQISHWRVTYANVTGLYMAAIFFINQIVSFFLISNLSKDTDTVSMLEFERSEANIEDSSDTSSEDEKSEKLNTDKQNSNYNSFNESESFHIKKVAFQEDDKIKLITETEETPTIKTIISKFVFQIDGLLILTCSFFFDYALFSCEMWIPVIIVNKIGWGIKQVNAVYFSIGALVTIQMLVFMVRKITPKTFYFIYISNMTVMLFTLTTILLLKTHDTGTVGRVALLAGYAVFFAYDMLMDIYLITVSSLMVPSSAQSFVQALRTACQRVGVATALLTAGIAYPWIHILVPISMCITLLTLVALVLRRKQFMEPILLF